MASLLTTKQISSMLKTKRRQYVESVVGLGASIVLPKGAKAGSGAVGVLTPRKPVVLVFTIKSLPARAALQARNTFREQGMQLRKVPNGVVKAAAKNTPFELMMSGPTLIATPIPGGASSMTLPDLVEVAKKLQANDKINKGLLFTGMVHHGLFLTPKRVAEVDFEEPKKLPGLVASPGVGILQALVASRIPLIATLQTYHMKQAKEGNMDAVKALGLDAEAK